MEDKKWYIALRGAGVFAAVTLALVAYDNGDISECVAWLGICSLSVFGTKSLVK